MTSPSSYVCKGAMTMLLCGLCACGRGSISEEEAAFLRDDYVRLDNVEPRLADDFTAIELRAHEGVDPNALSMALEGNRVISRAIAQSFARSQRKSELRYWLQIAAENGDGISMLDLSISLRKENCLRANYWLQRSIETTHLPSLSRASAEQGLAEYRKTCKPGNQPHESATTPR